MQFPGGKDREKSDNNNSSILMCYPFAKHFHGLSPSFQQPREATVMSYLDIVVKEAQTEAAKKTQVS